MIAVQVPNRPFATERITGLALPDGIFETTIGRQRINAHFLNAGGSLLPLVDIYIESVSDPGIVVTPATWGVGALAAGASKLLSWDADFSAATPGAHLISFVAQSGANRVRILKKIFVTRVSFDPITHVFSAETPEGRMDVGFREFVKPANACCCPKHDKPRDDKDDPCKPSAQARLRTHRRSFLDHLRDPQVFNDPTFRLCLRQYLPRDLTAMVTPTPAYPGQYGDLPYQDPWWKILLCIIAALLALGAAIAEALDGTGEVTVSAGGGGGGTDDSDCCGVEASGSGTSPIAAGLLAAAATVATIAAASDERDPHRRGQDHTPPAAGELTTGERLDMKIGYVEPVALGRPFAVQVDWTYTRMTTGATYTHTVSEIQKNKHVLSKYEISAPNVIRRYNADDVFLMRARFFDVHGEPKRGSQLFVQCFLVGPAGQRRVFSLEDSGIGVDEKPNDSVYSGFFMFQREKLDARGIWTYYVIAQDVNDARQDMKAEDAAQIIGGMVVTHQLVIEFTDGECPFVPDGHVQVI